MKKHLVLFFLIGLSSVVYAKGMDCTGLLSASDFSKAVGDDAGQPKFQKNKWTGMCTYVNASENKSVTFGAKALRSQEEWTKSRDAVVGFAGGQPFNGVGSDAYEFMNQLFFFSSNKKYQGQVLYAEKGLSTPAGDQAEIRKRLALALDKALSKE